MILILLGRLMVSIFLLFQKASGRISSTDSGRVIFLTRSLKSAPPKMRSLSPGKTISSARV